MEKRLVLFLLLSAVIFFGWSQIYTKLYPPSPSAISQNPELSQTASPSPSVVPTPVSQSLADTNIPNTTSTNAELRKIKISTDYWQAILSSDGGVITDWTMTHFPDGKPIDPPAGVNLLSPQLSHQIGGALRFHIPTDSNLERQLNSAVFEVKNAPEQEIFLKKGERKEITLFFTGTGIEATKTLIFKGPEFEGASGFDFDFRAEVKRNGTAVDAYVVIGPSFGDQSVTKTTTYKHAPQLTYAVSGSVERETADSLKQPEKAVSSPVTWAAVDDNYFAMTIVPPRPAIASLLATDKKVSIGVFLYQNEDYHLYAGPKDLRLLGQVSTKFGLDKSGSQLQDIVSYGWLNFMRAIIKPIAQFMLWGLREINKITHNFGWSIVILTVLLNMLFFPLRWKSSVTMKRAAAMQPRMKDIQERMKKLDKTDPRMLDLQKEQIALMKEGNPLLGCLPLLLQMPFFMAVFAILTVSIEVRHAPFFGWLKDLSSPDPYWILPIVMCITMIAQTALTPSTADPMQKKVQYLMPPILTGFFFVSAPAGLVLYWMVSNLVGVVQQFIINRLNPTNPPTATNESSNGDSKKLPSKGKTRQAVANS